MRRWIPGADRLDGFVVAIGRSWVLLQRLSDQVTFDGWVRSMSDAGSLVTVFDELDRPDVCWIGSVDSVDEQSLVLREVNSRATWISEPRTFMSADVTRFDVGGGYEDALRLVAEPPSEGVR